MEIQLKGTKPYCKIGEVEYEETRWGSLRQKDPKPFKYDADYTDQYNTERYKTTEAELNKIRWDLIKDVNPKKVLDVGCGNGSFIRSLPVIGYGYDIVDKDYGIPMVEDIYGDYDVVCFWDSLEHMDDLSFLKDLNTKYVAVSMPFCRFRDDSWGFKDWKHRKVDEHIHYFDSYSLGVMMKEMGYVLECYNFNENKIRSDIFSSLFKKVLA